MRSFFEQIGGAQGAMNNQRAVSDDLVTVFGRHNPPHLGHKLTLDGAHKLAEGIGENSQADQRFYTSRSQDRKKNPLPVDLKTQFLKQLFPKHAEKWDSDDNVRTVLGAATKAYDDGYKNFHFVGGGDRRQGMEDLLRRYNGNLYNFDNIYSHSVGDRDEGDGLAGLSASKMRRFALGGDLDGFAEGIGGNMELARKLFDAVRLYSGQAEDWEVAPRYNQELIRELYKQGLYEEGDVIESLASGLIGTVHRCGTNHLICITEDGVMFKNFIHEVQHLNT